MEELNTQIQINKKLRERLRKLKITKRESYEEILLRLLKVYNEHLGCGKE